MASATSSVDDVFQAAQSLKPEQKLELISRLWESMAPHENFRPSNADLEEIKRRWADYEAGRVQSVPWEVVRDEIRRKLASHE